MAVLNNTIRQLVCDEFASEVSSIRGSLGNLTKAQLRAAFNAADDWVDANAASYNTALPVAARNALTTYQKAQILAMVVLKRHKENV